MGRARDIANVLSSSTALATDAEISAFNYLTQSSASTTYLTQGSASTTYRTINSTGLAKIIPSSVAVGSGTGSADSLGNVTFSGCSSVSLNGVFSATYLNYFISLNYVTSSISNQTWRLRVSGTDASGAHYQSSLVGINGQGTARNSSVDAGTSWVLNSGYTTAQKLQSNSINIFNPFATDWTTVNLMSVGVDSGNGTFARTGGENHIQATSYDGFTIITDSGTMTGTICVYGYTK